MAPCARPSVTLRDVARAAAGAPRHGLARAEPRDAAAGQRGDGRARDARRPRQLGYRPNPIARGLKTNRSYTIGVLVPDLTNPLFPPIVRGIEDRLERGRLHAADRQHRQRPRPRAQRLRGDARPPGRRRDHRDRAARPRRARRDGRPPDCRSCSSTAASRTARCRRRRPTTARARGWRSSTWSRSATRRIAHLGGPQARLDRPPALRRASSPAMAAAGLEVDPALVRFGARVHRARGRARCARELLDGGAGRPRSSPATT